MGGLIIMITLENAKEIVEFLEESLSNTYFHENAEANENGYKCAINDIKERYIESVLNNL
jgi:hypothetical protein